MLTLSVAANRQAVAFWNQPIIKPVTILMLRSWYLPSVIVGFCSLNTGDLMFMVPYGLSSAVSTRVSNEFGTGQPEAAKLAARVVIFIALSAGMVIGFTMILLRNFWGHLYSNESEVVTLQEWCRFLQYRSSQMGFIVVSLKFLVIRVLTGCGMQKIGARINLGAFYVAGIPMALLHAFVLHLNGMGLWLGIVCGNLTKLVLLMWITLRINWEKEATKAKDTTVEGQRQSLDETRQLLDQRK
ncbi:hypothetical protein EJB05_45280, partial [Eragrostis curvula]